MIRASLILKPIFDKTAFHNAVESVTGKNYLRKTDGRNLTESQEILSIISEYGSPYNSEWVFPLGFIFIGTTDLILQIPSIVHGQYMTNQESNSQIFGSIIVVATLSNWRKACEKVHENNHLESCFLSIKDQLPRPSNIMRLT